MKGNFKLVETRVLCGDMITLISPYYVKKKSPLTLLF